MESNKNNDILDLNIFKQHGTFLEIMYHHDGSTIKEISNASDLKYKYLSDIILYFEKRNIVRCEQHPKDKRIKLVCLTPLGKDLVNYIYNASYVLKYGKKIEDKIILPLESDKIGRKGRRNNRTKRRD